MAVNVIAYKFKEKFMQYFLITLMWLSMLVNFCHVRLRVKKRRYIRKDITFKKDIAYLQKTLPITDLTYKKILPFKKTLLIKRHCLYKDIAYKKDITYEKTLPSSSLCCCCCCCCWECSLSRGSTLTEGLRTGVNSSDDRPPK